MSVALTFPASSPGPLGLGKWLLSAPGVLGSSLSFAGKSSFLSLRATARDRQQRGEVPRPAPAPGRDAPGAPALPRGEHGNLDACGSLAEKAGSPQNLPEGACPSSTMEKCHRAGPHGPTSWPLPARRPPTRQKRPGSFRNWQWQFQRTLETGTTWLFYATSNETLRPPAFRLSRTVGHFLETAGSRRRTGKGATRAGTGWRHVSEQERGQGRTSGTTGPQTTSTWSLQ